MPLSRRFSCNRSKDFDEGFERGDFPIRMPPGGAHGKIPQPGADIDDRPILAAGRQILFVIAVEAGFLDDPQIHETADPEGATVAQAAPSPARKDGRPAGGRRFPSCELPPGGWGWIGDSKSTWIASTFPFTNSVSWPIGKGTVILAGMSIPAYLIGKIAKEGQSPQPLAPRGVEIG